jgi:uncharacterized DUF497 family protein
MGHRQSGISSREARVSFVEAMTVFGDPRDATIPDPIIHRTKAGRVLVVAYTEREGRIRLILARAATPTERRR